MGKIKVYQPRIVTIYLIRTGSESPARANCTKTFGKVAENNKVCRVSGRRAIISVNCSPKPISKSLQLNNI